MTSIEIQNLGKCYKQYSSRWSRLLDWMTDTRYGRPDYKWALKDITFHVEKGESVGIIGQNGAGKSTLLKLLTGTTQPTEGGIQISGMVSALLELGLGFHPDFTGRENAVISCQMMGFSHSHIDSLLPEIEKFSELGSYFTQPLRVYSTGMQMRLAFSTATIVCPDILIIDEALSVGDAHFQHKCIQRIRSYKEQGTTILFVSHDPMAVKSICDRAILFDNGTLLQDGKPEAVLDYYNGLIAKKNMDDEIVQIQSESGKMATRSGRKDAYIQDVDMLDEQNKKSRAFAVGDMARIKCRIHFNEILDDPTIGFIIRDRLGNDVFGTNTFHLHANTGSHRPGTDITVTFITRLNIGFGNYSITIGIHTGDTHIENNFDWWDHCLVFQVLPNSSFSFIGTAALPVEVEIDEE
ncbi:MAG: ABC transporter ATP-binding protein [Pseudomonadota bacterium]